MSIFLQALIWQFCDAPKAIWQAWKNFLLFNLNYFSIPILLKTFFSHWRKYYLPYGKRWDPRRFVEAFVFNMMSRIIGAVLRIVFIVLGLVVEVLIISGGAIIFIGWLLLPALLLVGFLFGLWLLI